MIYFIYPFLPSHGVLVRCKYFVLHSIELTLKQVLLVSFTWGSSKDDELVVRIAQNIVDRAVIIGKEMGVHHPFIYQNYAAKSQDVFAGYSVENQKRLRRVQKEVDPEGVFSRLQPGYFSL